MEEAQEKEIPRKRRRVSLFKKRKKADIRPLVRDKKKREYKRILFGLFMLLAVIFFLATALYAVRIYIIDGLFVKNEEIISPQSILITNDEVRNIINEKNLATSQINIATESGEITFVLNGKTKVFMTNRKDIALQTELVRSIDRQITLDGKQAILIDLRYNKPIVKF